MSTQVESGVYCRRVRFLSQGLALYTVTDYNTWKCSIWMQASKIHFTLLIRIQPTRFTISMGPRANQDSELSLHRLIGGPGLQGPTCLGDVLELDMATSGSRAIEARCPTQSVASSTVSKGSFPTKASGPPTPNPLGPPCFGESWHCDLDP